MIDPSILDTLNFEFLILILNLEILAARVRKSCLQTGMKGCNECNLIFYSSRYTLHLTATIVFAEPRTNGALDIDTYVFRLPHRSFLLVLASIRGHAWLVVYSN